MYNKEVEITALTYTLPKRANRQYKVSGALRTQNNKGNYTEIETKKPTHGS